MDSQGQNQEAVVELRQMLHSVEQKLDALSAIIDSRLPVGASTPAEQPSDPVDDACYSLREARKPSLRQNSIDALDVSPRESRGSWVAPRPGFTHQTSDSASSRCSRCCTPCDRLRSDLQETMSHRRVSGKAAWNPDSMSKILFDLFSIAFLLYDAFFMPYQLAWDVSVNETPVLAMRWATSLFWTFDLLLNLVTGFRNKEAALELDLWKSMKHYFGTWFLFDLALITCDWGTVVNLTSSNQWRWMQAMPAIRLLRSGRQVLRARTLVLKAKLMIQTKGTHLAIDICLLLLILLWVNHVVCCGWYGIGRYSQPDTGVTWLTNREYSTGGRYYDYLTAYHWAITQMTAGSMEVFPESSLERVYSVATVFFGLCLGSSLVATLTSMMTQYKMRLEASSQKFAQLNQFLVQRRAHPDLAMAIKLQVRARSSDVQRLKQKDVEYLSLVSKSLQEVLWHSWCIQHLSLHTFFHSLQLFDPSAMQTLCNAVIEAREFAIYDTVFEEGSHGNHMYFLILGSLHYNPGELAPEFDWMFEDPRLNLNPGDWCSESALWTLWMHLGTLEVASHAEVLCVDGTALPFALPRFPEAAAILSEYSLSFHKYVNESVSTMGDLAHGYNLSELTWGLSSEKRLQLAQPIIRGLASRAWGQFMSPIKIDSLEMEVSSGKCSLSYEGTEAVRNTFVVALRLWWNAGGQAAFLVKVGEVLRDSDEIVPSCLLPGVKRNWGESPASALQRIFVHDLAEIAPKVEIESTTEQESFMGTSPSYGIQTRYIRINQDGLRGEAHLGRRGAPEGVGADLVEDPQEPGPRELRQAVQAASWPERCGTAERHRGVERASTRRGDELQHGESCQHEVLPLDDGRGVRGTLTRAGKTAHQAVGSIA